MAQEGGSFLFRREICAPRRIQASMLASPGSEPLGASL